jgi:hypothetical protein
VLVILVAVGAAIFGMIHLTRILKPRQRAVAWLVFGFAIVWAVVKAVQLGMLGHATDPS